jgi:hypothetical protein
MRHLYRRFFFAIACYGIRNADYLTWCHLQMQPLDVTHAATMITYIFQNVLDLSVCGRVPTRYSHILPSQLPATFR